jgi:hypothetical protein
LRFILHHITEEVLSVFQAVWVRKDVSQVEPDLAVVGVTLHRGGIVKRPGPEQARLQLELHAFSLEDDASDATGQRR